MDLALPTSLGIWRAKAFYNEEDRRNNKWDWVNSQDHNQGIYHDSWVTEWKNQGVTIFNEFKPAKGHVTTLGMDIVQCYDGDKDVDGGPENKRIENIAGFAQHKWKIIPRLTLTAGLRYTDNTIWVDNRGDSGGYDITGRYEGHEDIERNWSKFLPKSFLTYELDGLSHVLRDTAISAGISRIWRSPDYHGDYNPQGKPTGAWLDPEHGVGYDLVLNRRLIGDIKMKINYAFYEINDYMAANADPEYGIRQRGGWVPPEIRGTGQEWKDYHINLEQIERKGIEIQISGHLTDDLYFLLGYAWQDFKYDGDKYTVSASEEIDERPKHCVLARCTYKLSDVTSLTLDYEYQDAQVIENWEEISDGIYEKYRTKIDSYNLLGLSIRHTLFENWQGIKQGVVRIYSQNLLNEEYRNMNAYPGTPVTVGTGITFKF
jgi:iron complex outermembrane receptor protein